MRDWDIWEKELDLQQDEPLGPYEIRCLHCNQRNTFTKKPKEADIFVCSKCQKKIVVTKVRDEKNNIILAFRDFDD